MRQYARLETSALLLRLASQVDRVAEAPHADAIHDLRVSIRRLSRCLRVFAQFYPRRSWRKLRRQLGVLMDTAGAVRDLDIAAALLAQAGISRRAAIMARLSAERRRNSRALQAEARHWKKGHRLTRGWRRRLEL